MHCSFAAAPVVALMLVLGAGASATAPTHAPIQLAQAVSADKANRRGDEAYDRKDYAESMRWYRQSAAPGYALGEANVGFLYSKGLGVPQDYKEAVRWYLLPRKRDSARRISISGSNTRMAKASPRT